MRAKPHKKNKEVISMIAKLVLFCVVAGEATVLAFTDLRVILFDTEGIISSPPKTGTVTNIFKVVTFMKQIIRSY